MLSWLGSTVLRSLDMNPFNITEEPRESELIGAERCSDFGELGLSGKFGWLIRGVVTHRNQDEGKRLNNKHSNQNGTGIGDFYFDEQKANDDDNVKTGRAVPQSAWSKEDKEQTQPFENKTGAQFSDEFSFKNTLSYLLNMFHELKKDIFGIKEMTSLKNTKDLTNSQDNSEDKVKQNKMGENNDSPKSDASTKNIEFEKKNQKPKSNYITDYYQNNDIKFVDDDLETSSDESDDSSHKSNEGASMHEISKNKDNACISDCSEIKRKPNRYSSDAEETTAIPMSQTKIPEESDKEFDDTKDDEKDDDFKESVTKPSKIKQNNSKTSREKTENTPSSKTGKCMKKNNNNSNNLNEKNEPTERTLKSAEILITRSPQNENFNKAKSERSNQNKTTDNLSKVSPPSPDSRSSGKNLQNKGGSDFYSKSGVLGQSTTLSSQSSKDVIYPDNIEKKPYASGMSSEKPTYKKQQEQITSLKPEEHEQARNKAKSFKNNDRTSEYTTVYFPSQEAGSEIANHEMSTDTEIEDSLKESKGKRLNVNSSHTTVIYSEKEPNSKTDGQQTPNSFDTGNTISPTTSGNIMNTDNLDEDPSDNLNGKNENEKSNATQQGKRDSETQRDSETEQTKTQQLNNNSEPEKSLKNNKLNDSNRENNYKEEDDNLASMTTNDLPSTQDSNREIQNHDVEGSDTPQEETQKNNENLNKKDEMREISPDQEYEYEEDNEDFDISDELEDIEMDGDFNQNQEGELIKNDRNEENDDEMNPGNTATVLRNESQISQHTGYVMEEKSQEQYNTFLEYFYKHSNNPLFQSLKNQSNNFSR
ncbi:hypothetical protein AVEN_52894-1 [Araneus ventricosus]|uniref:Uncharacterized protein n=1 Tax=Araneus ventricosus TaxID=182803 RepID=A0A4Y2R2Z5_ARAVE|nr:hypothetical protein AVEN_52894-1 [Araneus ventricosus]